MDIFTIVASAIGFLAGVYCAAESYGSRVALRILRLGDWFVEQVEIERRMFEDAERRMSAALRSYHGMRVLQAEIDAAYRRQMDAMFEQGKRESVPLAERLCAVVECLGCDSVYTTTKENVSPLTLCPECSEHGPQPMPATPVRQQAAVLLN